jgi:phosphate transport system substrate-binding protein
MGFARRSSLKVCGALLAAPLAALLVACNSGNTSQNVTLNGAGSTFVYPVMSRWTQAYHEAHSSVDINYQSIGSGGGVQQVKAGTVDFGASDYPLDDKALSAMKPVLQIPETAGPVAGIFLGKITSWRDPVLVKDNPGVSLPNTKIVVTHRTDGSGTTAAFTSYLSAVSPEWKSKVGQGGSVSWPGGIGGKGSEGVTENIRQSPGSIGYVELTYAQQNKLPVASVKNLAGKYVQPSTASTTAAIAGFADALSQDPRTPIVNPPASAAEAYPISTLTFLIVPKDGSDAAKRSALKSFIQYIITNGQSTAEGLNYAPLPDAVRQYDQKELGMMTTNGAAVQ